MNFLWRVLLMILILITLIFPLSVSLFDFHTHCFQLVCGTTLAWLALTLSPFSPLSPFLPWFPTIPRSPFIPWIPRVHSSQGILRVLCLLLDPAFHLILITNLSFYTFSSLGSVWPRGPGTPGTPGTPGIPFDPGIPGKPSIDRWSWKKDDL